MSKEITLLTTQEANDQSYDQGRYPDFFPVNIGDDFKLETIPELAVMIPRPRQVKINITSFRGLCGGAVHYYADIEADGIIRYYVEPETNRKIGAYGYLGEEFNRLPREKRDIWGGNYKIGAARPVTKADKDKDPKRWEYYDIGNNTNAFDTAEEAEATARAIVSARFSEEWEVIVNNPYTKTK